jgi:hypothetical protein
MNKINDLRTTFSIRSKKENARAICEVIFEMAHEHKTLPQMRGYFALTAMHLNKELLHVQELAQQINDHPSEGYVLFNKDLDAWILEVGKI